MTNQTMSSDTKNLESRGYVGDFNLIWKVCFDGLQRSCGLMDKAPAS